MSYATVTDVSNRLGRPISDAAEITQVETWLADVEDMISARFIRAGLDLATQVGLNDPSMATVIRVESDAVIRRIYRPQPGRTSTTRAVDDATVTDRWEAETYDDGLTSGEWDDLLPGISGTGAFSTRPGFEADTASWPWPGCWT